MPLNINSDTFFGKSPLKHETQVFQKTYTANLQSRDFRKKVYSGMRCLYKKKNFMVPLYGQGSTASRLQSHYKEKIYFLPLSP